MTREILPFETQHIPEAAVLLAARHRADMQNEPRLPGQFASEEVTARLLEALLKTSSGVVAVEDGKTVGYLLGTYDLGWGGRARLVPLEGYAVDAADPIDVLREIYTAASPAWIDEGYFQHTINVPAGDQLATEAFFSLGFGQMLSFGLRDTAPVGGVQETVTIRRAGPGDIDTVQALMSGLGRYNSTPPLYRPYVSQPDGSWPRRALVEDQLADEACSFWLAFEGDVPVGLLLFCYPEATELLVTPENSIYIWIGYVRPEARSGGVGKALLEAGLAWARTRGHQFCTVGWFSANLSGARFWTRRGYQPTMRRLERRLDERIVWAKASE